MNNRRTLLLLVFNLIFVSSVIAEPVSFNSGKSRTTLLELFTSEGCSSCPPADRWLSGLKEDPRLWKDIIPVAFHVDYWDYIGWKDTFSKPEYSARQRRYKADGFITSVYTPGFVINGREWRSWFNNRNLNLDTNNDGGELSVTLDNGTITASYTPTREMTKTLLLNIAGLGNGISTKVIAGENKGKNMTHDFIVLTLNSYPGDLSAKGFHWNIATPDTFSGLPEKSALAFWVTQKGDPTPMQATGGWYN